MPNWWMRRVADCRPKRVALQGPVLHLVDDPEMMRRQLAGEEFSIVPAAAYRSDISTDEITPARICYHFDETIADFVYTGLVCRGERPVAERAVRIRGFASSVAGKRRGKGSSREAAPFAEMAAGIRLVVAESFERIYETNCLNLGLLTTSDFSLLEELRRGGTVPIDAFSERKDPISAEIVRRGGLFAYNVARLQGTVVPPPIDTAARPMTLAEKILAAHTRGGARAVKPGDAAFVDIDLRFSHDYVTPLAATLWNRHVGEDVALTDPASVVLFEDHLSLLSTVMPPAEVAAGRLQLARALAERQRAFAARAGVRLHGAAPDGGSEGICHTLVFDRYALPGQIVLGTDSHTCQAGALGCLAFGCGTTEMFNAWFTRDVRVRVPPTVRIEVVGAPSPEVTAKDIMLMLLAHPFVRDGRAVGMVFEYGGGVVTAMEVDERATLANMAAEAGGFAGIVAPDERVVEFLIARRGVTREVAEQLVGELAGDPGCAYAATLRLDVGELVPVVATPGDPGNGRPAHELADQRIDIAYAGSCTAGKRSDMDLIAAVLRWGAERGLRVPGGVRFFVQCGSQDVLHYCEEAGHLVLFARMGAVLVPPSCGACINAGPGVSAHAGEVTISSINRNFPGRSGPGSVFLASSSTVAASALTGRITTWPALRRRVEETC